MSLTSCGFRGFPSENGLLRLYTERECMAVSGSKGRWIVSSGECLRPDDGSFSYDCAYLNTDPHPLEWLYSMRWIIGSVAVVGGVLAIRASMKKSA